MREVWSLRVNDKTLHDNSRIVGTWSTLKLKKLGLKTLNRMICWETDSKTPKVWKVRLKELSTEGLINWGSIKAWKTKPEYKEDK